MHMVIGSIVFLSKERLMKSKKNANKMNAATDDAKSKVAKTVAVKKVAVKKAEVKKVAASKPVAKTPVAQKKALESKKTAAEVRKAQKIRSSILDSVAKVILPLWFNYPSKSIRTLVNGPQMRPEAALALAFHGAILETSESSSVTHCEIMIYQYGFDKFEANYIAFMGTSSLNGAKLIKYLKVSGDDANGENRKLVLTAKGRTLYEFLRSAIVNH